MRVDRLSHSYVYRTSLVSPNNINHKPILDSNQHLIEKPLTYDQIFRRLSRQIVKIPAWPFPARPIEGTPLLDAQTIQQNELI